ncbi:hypothetical protein BsWGS_07610 [Bradybaena similaris]
MLRAGIIERSQSAWSSPIVIVSKRDGTHRFCCDYRALNKITRPVSYPLPLVSDILGQLAGSRYFTTLDAKSGFWSIPLTEDAKDKSTFASHRGTYRFKVFPFGLRNAPAVYMNLMDIVLQDLQSFSLAYIDDILVFTKGDLQQHLNHIQQVFDRFRQHNLKLSLKKCQFLRTQTRYLGFVINQQGVLPDEEKVRAIKEIPAPQTVREVRAFLGFAGYYRIFVPNYSQIAEPLVDLTRKYAKFSWTSECQKAFDFLKNSFGVVPLLSHPNPNKGYTLYTDASDTTIGACLVQEVDSKEPGSGKWIRCEAPIHFLSHKLSPSQCKWSTVEKECYAIYYSLQKLDFYLHNARFVVKTDHMPLRYLLEAPMENRKVQRWALSISGYDCEIQYIKGLDNTVADLLSRIPGECREDDATEQPEISDKALQINVLNSNQFTPRDYAGYKPPEPESLVPPSFIAYDMIAEQGKDGHIDKIKRTLEGNTASKATHASFMLIDGVVYYISSPDDEPHLRLYIPKHLQPQALNQYHEENGHMGTDKTFSAIRSKYYWPGLYKEVYAHVERCVLCKTRNLQRNHVQLQDTDEPPYCMAKIGVDVSGPYPKSLSGNRYMVTFLDHYSLWPESFAVPDKTSETVAQLLLEEIIPRFGCPLEIVSDNGPENTGRALQRAMQEMNIHHVTTSFYRPHSNSRCERSHRTLHDILSKKVQDNPFTWDIHLNSALAAIRTNTNSSTKHSPFFLLYGRLPVLPLDNLLRPRRKYEGTDGHEIILMEQHRAFVTVQRHVRHARERQRKYADRGAAVPDIKVGDCVFYKNFQKTSKLDARWKPYYVVIEKTGPVSFRIKEQLSGRIIKAHAEHLKAVDLQWNIPVVNPADAGKRRSTFVVPPEPESQGGEETSDASTPYQ